MAELYDLMVLIDASAPDERRESIVVETETLIQQNGTIVARHDWGARKITFEINHHPEADYRLWQFEGGNDTLDRLNHSLKIMDGVLRFRVIRQGRNSPPVPPAPDPVRAPRPEEADGRVAARAAADAPADSESEYVAAEPEQVAVAEPEQAVAPEPEAASEADAPAPTEA